MSSNASEGVNEYFELYNAWIELVFLNERHIDTATYKQALSIQLDIILKSRPTHQVSTSKKPTVGQQIIISVPQLHQKKFIKRRILYGLFSVSCPVPHGICLWIQGLYGFRSQGR